MTLEPVNVIHTGPLLGECYIWSELFLATIHVLAVGRCVPQVILSQMRELDSLLGFTGCLTLGVESARGWGLLSLIKPVT